MSLKTLPILFLNLGGEMLYILDQRLRAQAIANDKSRKVMHDIVSTMLNRRFMEELFKPQDAYSKKAMRTVFDRLAHASIMRLNSASMDKLYDLMTMAIKYQISLCKRPQEIILITLNHMDAIRGFVAGNDAVLEQVEYVYSLLKQNYACLNAGQMQLIRQTLLSFFQDTHIRVSIFLKDKVQTPNGRFKLPVNGQVPWDTDVPGAITYFSESGQKVSTGHFIADGSFQLADHPGSFELYGDRITKLGTNMYNVTRPVDATVVTSPVSPSSQPPASMTSESDSTGSPDPLAKAELNLLQYLIRGSKKTDDHGSFRLNLFNTDEEEAHAEKEYADTMHRQVVVDATKRKQHEEITRLMDEFSVEKPAVRGNKWDDMLDLMDSA